MQAPLVSIITPILKINKYLTLALDSILEQTLKRIELIIISSYDEIEKFKILYTNYLNKINFIFICTNILNAGTRRNLGINKSKGKYILFLDADDYFFSKESISILVNSIEKYSGKVLGASCVIYDEHKNEFIKRSDLINNELLLNINFNFFQNESGFYRFIYLSSFLKKRNNFTSLRRFQDSLFLVNTLLDAGTFTLIPDIVYVYRKEHKKINWDLDMYQDHLDGVFHVLQLSNQYNLHSLSQKMLINIFNTINKRYPILNSRQINIFKLINKKYFKQLIKYKKLFFLFPKDFCRALYCFFYFSKEINIK